MKIFRTKKAYEPFFFLHSIYTLCEISPWENLNNRRDYAFVRSLHSKSPIIIFRYFLVLVMIVIELGRLIDCISPFFFTYTFFFNFRNVYDQSPTL